MRVVEVGPRDGLQNEAVPIPTEVKLRFITGLRNAGLREIEATSFVSPKWVPQLGDAAELWPKLPAGPLYSALVPNEKGLDRALSVGVDRIALFTAASEAFVRKNINMSVEESIATFRRVAEAFRAKVPRGWVRGYVSTAFECPYEGRIPAEAAVKVASALKEFCDEISLGDTIGTASPREVSALVQALREDYAGPLDTIALHFHDTNGTAIANVSRAMEMEGAGVFAFDSSAAGLGGCPFAPGAGGNLATEDLVYFLEREGVRTGIDLDLLVTASEPVRELLGRPLVAKAAVAAASRRRCSR